MRAKRPRKTRTAASALTAATSRQLMTLFSAAFLS